MLLDKLFPSELIEYNRELILNEYQIIREKIEEQLTPPICKKIRTETIAETERISKKLKQAGLNNESKEAHGLALRGCAAWWINLLGNQGSEFNGEKILSEVMELEERH